MKGSSSRPMKDKKKGQAARNRSRAAAEAVSETDSEVDVRPVQEVRAVPGESSRFAQVEMMARDHGRPSAKGWMSMLIDSGVHKTLLSEKDWRKIRKT